MVLRTSTAVAGGRVFEFISDAAAGGASALVRGSSSLLLVEKENTTNARIKLAENGKNIFMIASMRVGAWERHAPWIGDQNELRKRSTCPFWVCDSER